MRLEAHRYTIFPLALRKTLANTSLDLHIICAKSGFFRLIFGREALIHKTRTTATP